MRPSPPVTFLSVLEKQGGMKQKTPFISPSIERMAAMARRHREFDGQLVWKVSQQPPHLTRVQATPESRELYNMYSQVQMECHRLTCYLRLNINPHGILFAAYTPLHQVEDLLVSHFLYRFPLYVIVFASKRGTFIGRDKTVIRSQESFEKIIQQLENELPLDPILEELKDTDDEVWESFYRSQYVKEKHNQQLFSRNVPKQFLNMESFSVERKFSRREGLEGFFV